MKRRVKIKLKNLTKVESRINRLFNLAQRDGRVTFQHRDKKLVMMPASEFEALKQQAASMEDTLSCLIKQLDTSKLPNAIKDPEEAAAIDDEIVNSVLNRRNP